VTSRRAAVADLERICRDKASVRASILLALLCFLAGSATAAPAVRADEHALLVLGATMERLDGVGDAATIQDVLAPSLQARFRPVGTDRPAITPKDGTVWLRAAIELPADPDFQIVVNAIRAEVADLYAVDARGQVVREVAGGLASRDRTGRMFALQLRHLGGEQVTIYLRMRTQYISTAGLHLETIDAGWAREHRFEHLILLLLGALSLTIVVYAAMWMRISGAVHRAGFAMSLAALPLAQMYLGFDRELWPGALLEPGFNRWFYQFCMGGFYAGTLLFALHFLQLADSRLLARGIRVLAFTTVGVQAIGSLTPQPLPIQLNMICILASLAGGTLLCGLALLTRAQSRGRTLAFAVPTALSLVVQTIVSMQVFVWRPLWQWLAVLPLLVVPLGGAALLADSVRRRLQTLVQERTQALVEAIESRDRVLRLVAHDLRNPVGSIHAATELLLAAPSDPSRVRLLEAVQRGSEAALRLMDDLLDVAAIERGTATIDRQHVDASGWLRQRCELLRLTATRKSLALRVETDGPCWGWFDPARTGQALDNLVGNALKFSPPGSTVTVSCEALPADLVFRVRDQGPGIDAAELQRLFREFETGEARPTGGERSTGLGLTIARTLIQAQGGRITVESTPGEGTCFAIWLPRNEAAAPSAARRLDARA
jgi:signal transduction histidine kinase